MTLVRTIAPLNVVLNSISCIILGYAAIQLHTHSKNSALRVKCLSLMCIGWFFMLMPWHTSVWLEDATRPALSYLSITVCWASGSLVWFRGLIAYWLELTTVSAMQFAFTFNQPRAVMWTRRLKYVSWFVLVVMWLTMGVVLSVGMFLSKTQTQRNICLAIWGSAFLVLAPVLFSALILAWLELNALIRRLNERSVTAKRLKSHANLLLLFAIAVGPLFPLYPMLGMLPAMRQFAGTVVQFAAAVYSGIMIFIGWYELQRIERKSRVRPHHALSTANEQVSVKEVAGNSQTKLHNALQDGHQKPVTDTESSGVSLRFMEQFYRDEVCDMMSMEDVCKKCVKPLTEDIGGQGSGALVEVLQQGKDRHGRPWCGRPSYMVQVDLSFCLPPLICYEIKGIV